MNKLTSKALSTIDKWEEELPHIAQPDGFIYEMIELRNSYIEKVATEEYWRHRYLQIRSMVLSLVNEIESNM